jgi:dCTP deaminase
MDLSFLVNKIYKTIKKPFESSKCLASQDIRALIQDNILQVPNFDEARIQPSSFEPTIGDEIFILDTDTGIFRPRPNEQVYRSLLQLPMRQRAKVNISNGFEIKRGYSYLIPLNEKIHMFDNLHVKSSPKSSFGRLFLETRLISDYTSTFDEINHYTTSGKEVSSWLLAQPLPFNLIIYPGLSLNQLRFINGYEAMLTSKELQKIQILWNREGDNLVPAHQVVTDGLAIHLDLSGKNTQGIVGLRARHNPMAIDLSKIKEYEAEEFFEPIKMDGQNIKIKRGEYYLFASSEVLKVPKDHNVELRAHSHVGFNGPMHFAGFVDNGFVGDLVFEVRSDELSTIMLEHDMPISKLDVFKTNVPDKLYGENIGSNYQLQIGVRPAKFFKPFDFVYAAKNYKKLDRVVLVEDADVLKRFRKTEQGFEWIDANQAEELIKVINNGFFHSRYDCEKDTLILQPIGYVLEFNYDREIFSYVRAKSITDYGDVRLFEKHSYGVGGHMNLKDDAPDFVNNSIVREEGEEITFLGSSSHYKIVGTLMAYDKEVDRVHFGLVFKRHTEKGVVPAEKSISSGRMISIDEVMNDPNSMQQYETWSRVLIPYLVEIYNA